MNYTDLEQYCEATYVFIALGVVSATILIKYLYKQAKVRRKLRDRRSECQASLKKLEEYLGENGVG